MPVRKDGDCDVRFSPLRVCGSLQSGMLGTTGQYITELKHINSRYTLHMNDSFTRDDISYWMMFLLLINRPVCLALGLPSTPIIIIGLLFFISNLFQDELFQFIRCHHQGGMGRQSQVRSLLPDALLLRILHAE